MSEPTAVPVISTDIRSVMNKCYVFEPGKEPVIIDLFKTLLGFSEGTYRSHDGVWCKVTSIGMVQTVQPKDVPPEIRLTLLLLQ